MYIKRFLEPNWETAPEWANYRVICWDGCIVWTEKRPKVTFNGIRDGWSSEEVGRFLVIEFPDWRDSLRVRPGHREEENFA